MAIKKVKYNDTYIYIDDELKDEETGIAISKEKAKEELEKTKEIVFSNNNDINLEDTIVLPTNLGDNNG